MIIRTGYVSNSSTSSFTLVGIVIHRDDIEEEFGKEMDYDDLYQLFNHSSLEVETGIQEYDEDDIIIGRDFRTMKDDQTLKDFKLEVLKILVDKGWKPNDYKRLEIACDEGYRS